jgi:curved DNA-binding protein CbpA
VNPFTALGLPASAELDDEQVRDAWRAIAARTHPDRPGGGDPGGYAAAAAAYAQLRTPWGRGEALADLAAADDPGGLDGLNSSPPAWPVGTPPAGPVAPGWRAVTRLPGRIRRGRPAVLAAPTAIAVVIAVTAATLIPGTPSKPAVIAGAALWWALTARGDLAPPRR